MEVASPQHCPGQKEKQRTSPAICIILRIVGNNQLLRICHMFYTVSAALSNAFFFFYVESIHYVTPKCNCEEVAFSSSERNIYKSQSRRPSLPVIFKNLHYLVFLQFVSNSMRE